MTGLMRVVPRYVDVVLDAVGVWGERVYAFAHADTKLTAAFLFLLSATLWGVIALPVDTYGILAIKRLAPEWVWNTVSGATCAMYLHSWWSGQRLTRWMAPLAGTFTWTFIAILAFQSDRLILMGVWTSLFSVSSVFLFWRAYLD